MNRRAEFAELDAHTEALISWLSPRLDEDEILAAGMRHARLHRAVLGIGSARETMRQYREAAAHAAIADEPAATFWRATARYLAFIIRLASRRYRPRGGFNPTWLHPPPRR